MQATVPSWVAATGWELRQRGSQWGAAGRGFPVHRAARAGARQSSSPTSRAGSPTRPRPMLPLLERSPQALPESLTPVPATEQKPHPKMALSGVVPAVVGSGTNSIPSWGYALLE